ncbi:hypothetical protein [Streptomyces sp. NPDC006997]|uniref:hypothetical protein n=1 Tax=Streptomyces sp. NPDC006997 TaxID=3155356 RepID=UPI0033DA2ED8
MVEAELMALAAAGATAVVQQMATDSWTRARDRVAAFFSRRGGGGTEDAVAGELETSRGELTAALASGEEQTLTDVEAEWRTRLRRALLADPRAAAELRALLDELALPDGVQPPVNVRNSITGGVQHGPVIQTGNLGSVTIGTPPADGAPHQDPAT